MSPNVSVWEATNAPPVNTISIPVVAEADTITFAEYNVSVEVIVKVPVANCVRVGDANVPNVSEVLA